MKDRGWAIHPRHWQRWRHRLPKRLLALSKRVLLLMRRRSGASLAASDQVHKAFSNWLSDALSAESEGVVVIFASTSFLPGLGAARPSQLAKRYLESGWPVFYSNYGADAHSSSDTYSNDLLCQSRIDASHSLLDDLLTSNFGGKKILHVAFPHVTVVRYLTLAAQYGWVTVYDADHDMEELANLGMAPWYFAGYERYLAANADIVSAVSRRLARKLSTMASGRFVHTISNALDQSLPRLDEHRMPNQTSIVGYLGSRDDHLLDWQLTIAAADRYPDFTFELLGVPHPEAKLPPNIKLFRSNSHAELTARSQEWSLAFVPYQASTLTEALDPAEIYRYLNLGLPVLTTYLPQCHEYPCTTVTEGREEFLSMLGRLVANKAECTDAAEWLLHNTWQDRIDAYIKLADEINENGRDDLAHLLDGGR